MKNLPLLLFLLWSINVIGQGALQAVTAAIDMTGSVIKVQQNLSIDMTDPSKSIDLKALEFEGTTLSKISLFSGGEVLSYKEHFSKGLKHLILNPAAGKPINYLELSYEIAVKEPNFYLPFFFTNLPAASSENDFFKLNINIPENQGYRILFPRVRINEITDNGITKLNSDIPALPSMIRMELFSGDNELKFIDLIDFGVAIIFLVIAILIWIYRKHLIYG